MKLIAVIVSFYSVAVAGFASQTDWSGGDGIIGPVVDWSNQFYQSQNMDYSGIPGVLSLVPSVKYMVDGSVPNASCAFASDIDGDGDMDVIGSSYTDDEIMWYENVNGTGTAWTKNMITGYFDSPLYVYAVDFDSDGDQDVFALSQMGSRIYWWENVDGLGGSWTQYTVSEYWSFPTGVCTSDIDSDDDLDVVAASYTGIRWWENQDGSGRVLVAHDIDDEYDIAYGAQSEDLDGDSDMDVVSCSPYSRQITWWENEDGFGSSWLQHMVCDSLDGVCVIRVCDIDGDDDIDILSSCTIDNGINWWENTDGSGGVWTCHYIGWGSDSGANEICADDLDNDGDVDVLGINMDSDIVAWWDNSNGAGTSWIEHVIDDQFNEVSYIHSGDFDCDDCPDVLASAMEGAQIAWWDITPTGWLESSILDSQEDPVWDYLEWNSVTPAGTAVGFQIRASDNYGSMGEWSDTLVAPCILGGVLDEGASYVQYRALLSTFNSVTRPEVSSVAVTWDETGIGDSGDGEIPALLPFSPNPTPYPTAGIFVDAPCTIDLFVYDISGRVVGQFHELLLSSGLHAIPLGNHANGIYLCRIAAQGQYMMQRFTCVSK